MKRTLVVIVAIVGAGFGALALRTVTEGRAALAEGDAALAAKRSGDAISAWEAAARWYFPGAPHVDEAYDRLRDFARANQSLTAWRAIRTAALATRSLWTPHADDLALANAAIAEISADDPDHAPAAEADRARRLAWHQDRLAADPRPSSGAAFLAIVGIACWLVGIAIAVRRAGSPAGRPGGKHPALVGVAITVAGILAWAVGLYSA